MRIGGDLIDPCSEIVVVGFDRNDAGDRMPAPGEYHLDAALDCVDHCPCVVAEISDGNSHPATVALELLRRSRCCCALNVDGLGQPSSG